MRKIITILLIIFIIALVVISMPSAQQEQEQEQEQTEMTATPTEEVEQEESVVEITADQVNYDKEIDQMIFVGNVIIIQEDSTLNAGRASFNVDTKVGQISENVSLVQEDITITGNSLEAYLNDKRYIFENQVELIQEREDNNGEPDNVIWLCQKLDIFTDTKNMTASGEVEISTQDYTIFAQEAVYNDAEDKISLSGQVRIEEVENDRQISGNSAVFFVDDDKLEVTGNVRSSITLD